MIEANKFYDNLLLQVTVTDPGIIDENLTLLTGQSLTFHGAVVEAAARGFGERSHCRSAVCAAQVCYFYF